MKVLALWFNLLVGVASFCDQHSNLLKVLEEALLNDTSNLLALQRLFYPPRAIASDTVYVSIIPSNFTVKKIRSPDCQQPAFSLCEDGEFYCLNSSHSKLSFLLSDNSDSKSFWKLRHYVNTRRVMSIMILYDYVSYHLFNTLTLAQLNTEDNDKMYITEALNFSISVLEKMPTYTFTVDVMLHLLTWAKYYARSNGAINVYERRDSDRVLVSLLPASSGRDVIDWSGIAIILLYSLSFSILIIGVYSVPKLLKASITFCEKYSNLISTNDLCEFYWATVLVCGTINSVCFLTYHSSKYVTDSAFNLTYLALGLPLKLSISVVEAISIWIIIKDFKMQDLTCCICNPYVQRALHTYAICHILWFLHRVGCSFLVAIFFIALAPAQTLAVISLMYFVIFYTILYITFNIHYLRKIRLCNKQSCKLGCKLFALFMLYLCITSFVISLTLTFNQLAQNGLVSSGLGSVVLSLVAPTIVFVITLKIKHQFEKYFLPTDIDPSVKDILKTTGSRRKSALTLSLLQDLDSD